MITIILTVGEDDDTRELQKKLFLKTTVDQMLYLEIYIMSIVQASWCSELKSEALQWGVTFHTIKKKNSNF